MKVLYGKTHGIVGTSHMWFLPCFFISIMLFNYISIVIKKEECQFLTVAILGLISALSCYDSNMIIQIGDITYHLTGWTTNIDLKRFYIGFPFSINVALTGVVLIYLGKLTRKFFDKMTIVQNKIKLIGTIIFFSVIGTISFAINQKTLDNDFPYHLLTMPHAIYGNYLLFLLTSLSFTVVTLCLSSIIDNKYTSKYGTLTMAIYVFHPFILGVIGNLFPFIPSAKGIIPSIICLLIICVSIPTIRWFDSTLLGEKR